MKRRAGGHRFIIVRDGPPALNPWEVGDEVTTYELEEPYFFSSEVNSAAQARRFNSASEDSISEDSIVVDLHAMAQARADFIKPQLSDPERWRELEALKRFCPTCAPRRILVAVYVEERSVTRWCLIQPERVPAAYRTGRPAAAEAWPLSLQPDGVPHPGIVTCKGCRKSWAYLLYNDRVDVIGIKRKMHGARITDG